MDHGPFIIASYLATAVVLAWCAFSPLFRTRKVLAKMKREISRARTESVE